MRKLVTPLNVLLIAESAPSWREEAVLGLMFDQFVFGHSLKILTFLLTAFVLFLLVTGVFAKIIVEDLSIAVAANRKNRAKLGPLLSSCKAGL